jgi:hypothetical protein
LSNEIKLSLKAADPPVLVTGLINDKEIADKIKNTTINDCTVPNRISFFNFS